MQNNDSKFVKHRHCINGEILQTFRLPREYYPKCNLTQNKKQHAAMHIAIAVTVPLTRMNHEKPNKIIDCSPNRASMLNLTLKYTEKYYLLSNSHNDITKVVHLGIIIQNILIMMMIIIIVQND